jgi:hypothetical protein
MGCSILFGSEKRDILFSVPLNSGVWANLTLEYFDVIPAQYLKAAPAYHSRSVENAQALPHNFLCHGI